jgi:hypothetical protein
LAFQSSGLEPEEDYSRNASCTLMSIYTFLLCQGELISRGQVTLKIRRLESQTI